MIIVENDPVAINERLIFTIRDLFVKDQFVEAHDENVLIPRSKPDDQPANTHRFFWYWLVIDSFLPRIAVLPPKVRPANPLHKFISAIGTVPEGWQPQRIYQQGPHVAFNGAWEVELNWNLTPIIEGGQWYEKAISQFAPHGALAYAVWRVELGRSAGRGPGFCQVNLTQVDYLNSPPNGFPVQVKGWVPHDSEPYITRDELWQPAKRDQMTVWVGTHSTPAMVSLLSEGYVLAENPITTSVAAV